MSIGGTPSAVLYNVINLAVKAVRPVSLQTLLASCIPGFRSRV